MDENELMEAYLEVGVLIEDLDENGEIMYYLGPNAKTLAPEFYNEMLQEIDESLSKLQREGLVEASGVNEEGEIVYGLTEFGEAVAGNRLLFGSE
jgi:hypothetical protein